MSSCQTPCFACTALREELAATRAALLELATRAPASAATASVPGHAPEPGLPEGVVRALNKVAPHGNAMRRELTEFASRQLAAGVGEPTVIAAISEGATFDIGDDE